MVTAFIDSGFKSIIVAAHPDLREICGKLIDHQLLNDLDHGVDQCGENGEFHSFVFDGPLFNRKLNFDVGETIFKPFQLVSHARDLNADLPLGNWYTDLV